MKRKIFAAALSLLIVFLSLPAFVAADASPTTKSEFEASFSSVNELRFGYNHFGAYGGVEEPMIRTAGPYRLEISTVNSPGLEGMDGTGLFNDPDDLTADSLSAAIALDFSDPLPRSVCLGLIATGRTGDYLAGESLIVSVNNGDWAAYTTKLFFEDNAYIIQDPDGISGIQIYRGTENSTWAGISYILLPGKLEQDAPAAPTVADKTTTSIELTEIEGAQYRIGEDAWTDDRLFTGLSPGTEYTFYARYTETTTHHLTGASLPTLASTDKGNQTAPPAPLVDDVTPFTVTLQAIPGAEYKEEGGDWQDEAEFTSLNPGMDYVFYARLKETDTLNASPSSAGTTVTTPTKMPRTLTHTPSGISMTGIIHFAADLLVEEATLHEPGECAACDAIRQRMDDDDFLSLMLVDISLDLDGPIPYSLPIVTFGLDDGPPVPDLYSGQLTLTIPVNAKYNGKTLTVLHCAQGTLETYTPLVEGGKITLTVTELSPFGIFGDADPAGDNPPATGASGQLQILGLLSLLLAGGFLLILRLRTRTQDV
ncbi:MAG: hypothetical protein WDA02_04210 [Saccharofermentanales bacterium]